MKKIDLRYMFTTFLCISLSVNAHIDESQNELGALLLFHDPGTTHALPSHSEIGPVITKTIGTTTYQIGTASQTIHSPYPGLHDLGTLDTVLLTGWRFLSVPHLSQTTSTIGEYMKHHGKQTFSLLSSSDMASVKRFANTQNPLDTLITVLTGLGLLGLGIALRGNRR